MRDNRIVYERGDYIVKKIRKGYYLYNRKRLSPDEHTHIKTKKTCKDLIDMIYREKVPDSNYLKRSVLRICKNEKLLQAVRHKVEKDKQKPKFVRVCKGVVKR